MQTQHFAAMPGTQKFVCNLKLCFGFKLAQVSYHLFTFRPRWSNGSRLARVALTKKKKRKKKTECGLFYLTRLPCFCWLPHVVWRNSSSAVSILIRHVLYKHGSLCGGSSSLSLKIGFWHKVWNHSATWVKCEWVVLLHTHTGLHKKGLNELVVPRLSYAS